MEIPPRALRSSAHPPAKPPSNRAGWIHNFFTHCPKDPDCEVCRPTKATRAPCQRNADDRADRIEIAQRFGSAVAAGNQVLKQEQEFGMHHKYTLVVQDLATQWIHSCQCKTKSAQEMQRSLRTFSHPEESPRSVYTDNTLEFAIPCEELNWNHERSTPHRSETNGGAERAVRRVKEGTSSVLVQSRVQESWEQKQWCVTAISEMCKTYLQMARRLANVGSIHNLQGQSYHFGAEVTFYPISSQRPRSSAPVRH